MHYSLASTRFFLILLHQNYYWKKGRKTLTEPLMKRILLLLSKESPRLCNIFDRTENLGNQFRMFLGYLRLNSN